VGFYRALATSFVLTGHNLRSWRVANPPKVLLPRSILPRVDFAIEKRVQSPFFKSLLWVTSRYEMSNLLIPLIFHAIEQASTAILVVLLCVLLFVECFQLLEVVLRRMFFIRGEPCFILCAFALLVFLVILVGACVDICQICIQAHTVVYIRLRILALFRGNVD
jgi:hypothetical protein